MRVLVGELSARGAGRPLISRGRRGGIGRHGLVPREGALSALGSGRLLCCVTAVVRGGTAQLTTTPLGSVGCGLE